MLNRNLQRNQQSALPDRAGTPEHPIGRGRPLPPPGQPLPFPDRPNSPAAPKRKPVASPALPQRRQDETKTRPIPPPPLPARKRQGSVPLDNAGNEGLLVVEAPPEEENSSPTDDKDVKDKESVETGYENDETASSADVSIDFPPGREVFDADDDVEQHWKSHGDEVNALSSWQVAQEEEARSKSIWMDNEGHS